MSTIKTSLTVLAILLAFLWPTPATGSESFQNGGQPLAATLEKGQAEISQTNILLFGALGDLAKKYLWLGLFNLYSNSYKRFKHGRKLAIYGAGRTAEDKGTKTLSQIMEQTKFCDREVQSCWEDISAFKNVASYHKTKSEEDYKMLSEKISQDLVVSGAEEKLRIIYLSVPPFAYPTILSFVHKYLRPMGKEGKLRIVFEKPFGHDRNSSQALHNLIMQYFKEREIYRIDHYLGKMAVEEIVNFREQNQDKLINLWNDDFIDSVEIVMKEKVDCKGRTEFYDEYGVVLDVMQNHMTEIFARLVMDLPKKSSDFAKLKVEALRNVASPSKDDVVLGQYSHYKEHLAVERKQKSGEKSGAKITSSMPTFAAIKMVYNSERLKKTPFYFVSGKKLNEKTGYVRINFKSLFQHHISSFENHKESNDFHISFFIHSSQHNGPAIEISQGLSDFNFKFSSKWKDFSSNGSQHLFVPRSKTDAYTFLIQKINDGDRSYFVDIDSLLESWRVWDPIQKIIKAGKVSLTEYEEGGKDDLDFYFDHKENKLKFIKDGYQGRDQDIFSTGSGFQFSALQDDHFLGNKLVTGDHESVMKNLALFLVQGINDADKNNDAFHIAFPGGSSIVPLFKHLCLLRNLFTKNHLHIWMVDERCEPLNSTKSNFKQLISGLQKCLDIPYQNLHPMHVGFGLEKCKKENAISYAEEISSWMPSMEFDFIILGVGEDGHVASLFPGDHESHESKELIIVNQNGPQNNVPLRMSISFRLINSAKKISIIATGRKKHGIVQKLKEAERKGDRFPALMVKPFNGSLIWFIDDTALN